MEGRYAAMDGSKRGVGQFLTLCLAVVLPCTLAACAHASAKAPADSPPLEMPSPPKHDIEPIDVEPLVSPPVTAEPDDSARRATNPRPRTTPPAREPAKPEPPKPEPPKPETQPPEAPKAEEPHPAPPLQTAPATVEGESERTIRATIQRATIDLNHVDYRALNVDGRAQYDQAKRLMRQADDAIREKNLVFARSVADKAATIAAQLARR